MYKSGATLVADEQFETARIYSLHIVIYQSGKLIGFGGPIIEFDAAAVKINGSWYMRDNCEFVVR